MPSQAARDRALRRGPGALGFLLAHHGPGQLDHCYQTWMAGRPVWFCARCSGLYPAFLLVLIGQFVWRIPSGWWDLAWLYLLALPAVFDWATHRLEKRKSHNRHRTFTGMLLGLALGRGVYLNMVEPAHTLVLVQLSALAVAVGSVELVARAGLFRSRSG